MKTNKIVCILALLFAAVSVNAKPNPEGIKTLVTTVAKKNVVLIGRVETSGIDTESRLYPFSASPFRNGLSVKFGKSADSGDVENPKVIYRPEITSGGNILLGAVSFPSADGEYFIAAASPKKTACEIKNFEFHMFPKISNWFAWLAGPETTVTYPDDAEYVYVGTFRFTFDANLNTVGFKHIDEYDQTKKILSEAMGEDIKLYRAELNFHN